MSEIISIDQLRSMAVSTIEIPGFDVRPIKVRVQKPRLMAMAAQGKIPNYLMSIAMRMAGVSNQKKDDDKDPDLSEIAKMMELYCHACMVQPAYDEFKDIMTDEQMQAIFEWALGGVQQMSTFHPDEEDGPDHHDGEGVSETSE